MSRIVFSTSAPRATVIIRLLVGVVFLSEGIQKFLFSDALGIGRFEKIGIPSPEIMVPFVGGVEIVCGVLVIIGLLTRPAAVALLISISVAIISTKIPIAVGHGVLGFSLPKMPSYGFWPMAHEARVDFCMWLGSLFLLIAGAGPISLDARVSRRSAGDADPPE